MEVLAPAKINLALKVTGRRPDGYHTLEMVMQTVSLADQLYLRRIPMGLRLVSSDPQLPTDERNLVVRAVRALEERVGPLPVEIELVKAIPQAAGLAGGSADGAATLRGLRDLFSLELSDEDLAQIGLSLGADFPFCLLGGTALAQGIGEILTPLRPLPPLGILLIHPPLEISTPWAFQELDRWGRLPQMDLGPLMAAIERGEGQRIGEATGNHLELVAFAKYPQLAEVREQLEQEGAWGARMSGSGPTLYGIFPNRDLAGDVGERLSLGEGWGYTVVEPQNS